MANLVNDIGNALKATIAAASSAFTALDTTGSTLHVEYATKRSTQFPDANRCLILPSDPDPIDGTDYDASAQTQFNYVLMFELLDVDDATKSRQVIQQAVMGAFRDRGADVYSNFTDNGSNLPAGAFRVVTGQPIETTTPEDEAAERYSLEWPGGVRVWHKVPLA